MNNLTDTSLDQIVSLSARMLKQQTFYTVGVQQAKAWSIKQGSTAPEAAGEIHTDLQRGFINAEVIKPDDFIKYNGEAGCKAAGAITVQGKSYVVQDGDILHVRFTAPKK